jgi:hypothetical protein
MEHPNGHQFEKTASGKQVSVEDRERSSGSASLETAKKDLEALLGDFDITHQLLGVHDRKEKVVEIIGRLNDLFDAFISWSMANSGGASLVVEGIGSARKFLEMSTRDAATAEENITNAQEVLGAMRYVILGIMEGFEVAAKKIL